MQSCIIIDMPAEVIISGSAEEMINDILKFLKDTIDQLLKERASNDKISIGLSGLHGSPIVSCVGG